MADTSKTTKSGNTFDSVSELFMKLIFILSTSWTRCPVILNIKACHMQPVSPSQFQKGLSFPPDPSLTLSDMSACHRGYLLSVVLRLELPCLSDTSRLTLWLTGVVKTAGVTSDTWQHISECVFGWNLWKSGIKYSVLPYANSSGNNKVPYLLSSSKIRPYLSVYHILLNVSVSVFSDSLQSISSLFQLLTSLTLWPRVCRPAWIDRLLNPTPERQLTNHSIATTRKGLSSFWFFHMPREVFFNHLFKTKNTEKSALTGAIDVTSDRRYPALFLKV